jgi:hypothetical protein
MLGPLDIDAKGSHRFMNMLNSYLRFDQRFAASLGGTLEHLV